MTETASTLQMIDCARFHTRMTKIACDRYRADHPENCKGCAGSGEVVAELPRTVVPVANKRARQPTGKTGKHKVAACSKCHRVMPLPGRGLCGKCYSATLKSEAILNSVDQGKVSGKVRTEKPAVSQPAAQIPTENVNPVVPEVPKPSFSGIDWLFAGEADLLAKVEDLARKDRRDVRNEVLCIIEAYFEGAE